MSKKKYEIYLTYNERETYGQICAGQENESFPEHEPGHKEFQLISAHRNKKGLDWVETVGVDFNPDKVVNNVFVVVVRYTDGGTFGYTTGYWDIPCVFDDIRSAQKTVQKINNGKYRTKWGYVPWEGYFAKLEYVEIIPLALTN